MKQEVNNHIRDNVEYLIDSWTETVDGVTPLVFSDKLAYALFCSSLCGLCQAYLDERGLK